MKIEILSLLPAAKTADWVFGSILSLLTLALIVLTAIALSRRAARKKAAAAPRPAPAVPPPAPAPRRENLVGSLAGGEAPAAPRPAPRTQYRDDRSIDKHYADRRGQWICPYCETINDPGLVLCQACGQPRN